MPWEARRLKRRPAHTDKNEVTRLRLRDHGPGLALAALGVWAMAYVTLYGFGWNDYSSEVAPAYAALTAGHVSQFLALAPAYGGSLELRAPFALLPGLWGGGAVAVYQAVSIPCLVAAALLALWLVAQMRALGHDRLARTTTFGLCIANPVTFYALQDGHAEELLGAVLCVSAVLAAQRGRVNLSALALGLAIANKPWALVATGPVLVALPAQRLRAVAISGALALCFYLPLWLPAAHSASSGAAADALPGASAGTIFQPWQLWWFLGSHGHLVTGSFGEIKAGYRSPPSWLQSIDHPLIILLAVPATLLAIWRRVRPADALLLLAFLLAIRFAADTWDTVYYPLPCLFALLAWESLSRRGPPVLSLAASVLVWLVFIVAPERLSPDAQAALFVLVALPALLALGIAVFAADARRHGSLPAPAPAQRRSSASSSTPVSTV